MSWTGVDYMSGQHVVRMYVSIYVLHMELSEHRSTIESYYVLVMTKMNSRDVSETREL